MYVRGEAPVEISALKVKKEDFATIVGPILPAFDVVYSGYSSHREKCHRTAAWGRSAQCALFIDWNDDDIIKNIWAELFEQSEDSIRAASKAIAALGKVHRLVYVDWAWKYTCDASEEEAFASRLRNKLRAIAESAHNL